MAAATKKQASGPVVGEAVPSAKVVRKRREQRRVVVTKSAILAAALSEFAERGFDGASMRRIGERANVEYTLITYHFRTKDGLWRAVAENAFAEIQAMWDEASLTTDQSPAAQVKMEFRAILDFMVTRNDFHHFMLRENQSTSPRLPWLIDNILKRMMRRVLPQIEAAQKEGGLIPADPTMLYYLLIGMVSVLSSLRGEMKETIGFDINSPECVERYWNLIERAIFD